MEAAHHTAHGHTLVVLHELHRIDLLIELALREALEEVAPRVLEYPRLDNEQALYSCLDDVHILKR